MRWHDRRFVVHRNFKFYCLNLIQRRQIDGLVRQIPTRTRVGRRCNESSGGDKEINIADLKKVTDEKELTKSARRLLQELKPFFKAVRGSGLYWKNVRDDVMSMLGNGALPTKWPTFFFTLSAADTVWPDFIRVCRPELSLEEAGRLSARDRQQLLNENPDLASHHFHVF